MTHASITPLQETFVLHHQRLRQVAQRILRNPQAAEDAVQDAYLKAVQQGGEAPVEHPLRYACCIVRNLALDRYHRGTLEARLFECEQAGLGVCEQRHCPEARAAHRQQLRLVAQALAGLPERSRQVFEMHRLQGLTQKQIAERFQISPAMVNLLIRQVVDRCRAVVSLP